MEAPKENNELLLKQDDIQEHRLMKERDHNMQKLISLLHIEAESLAKTKVKEGVMQYSSQIHLQEIQEIQEALKKPMVNLIEHKEQLQQQLQLGNVYLSQFEEQMVNTEKVKDILLEHYSNIQKRYECESKNFIELKEKLQVTNYKPEKENVLKLISDKKEQINSILNESKRDLLLDENEVNEKKNYMKKITESVQNIDSNIENAESKLEALRTEHEKTNILVIGSNQNIHFTRDTVSNCNSLIEELEEKIIRDEQNNNLTLKNFTDEIDSCIKDSTELERKELILEGSCVQESNKCKDLEDLFSKLEDENEKSQAERDRLYEEKGDLIKEWNCLELPLNNELRTTQSNLNELKSHVNEVVLDKRNKEKDAEVFQQKCQEAELKQTELQDLKPNLVNDISADLVELETLSNRKDEMKGKMETSKSSRAVIQEKHAQEKEIDQKLHADLDYKLLLAQSQLQEVANQYETTCKSSRTKISDYKYQLEQVDQQNQEDYKKMLDKLTNEIAMLKNTLNRKSNCLTSQLIVKKKFNEKYRKEFENIKKKKDELSGTFKEPPAMVKPAGILKSPGKIGVSPKKVKFDVAKSSITESESDLQSQVTAKDDILNELLN